MYQSFKFQTFGIKTCGLKTFRTKTFGFLFHLFSPRIYPVRFGWKTVSLMPKLKSRGRGMPVLKPEEPIDGPEVFRSMEWEDQAFWEDARFKSILVYLRGNTSLQLPEKWKEVFPKHIWFQFPVVEENRSSEVTSIIDQTLKIDHHQNHQKKIVKICIKWHTLTVFYSRKCQRLNQSRQDLKAFLIPYWSPKRVYTCFLQELGNDMNLFIGFLWFLKLLSSFSKEKTHFSTLTPFRPVRTRSDPFGPEKRQHFFRTYP